MRTPVDDRGLSQHFDDLAPSYDGETSWRMDPGLLGELARYVPTTVGAAVDIGCGTGLLRACMPPGSRVVGVDFSHGMLMRACSRHLLPVRADVRCLPFRDRVFELALIRQVLQYVCGEAAAMEVARICRPGGLALLHHFTVPDGAPREWWAIAKRHLQAHRRFVLTDEAVERAFSRGGWAPQARAHAWHRRVVPIPTYFSPSRRFARPRELADWMARSAAAAVPESRVEVVDDRLAYTQRWTLAVFRREGDESDPRR